MSGPVLRPVVDRHVDLSPEILLGRVRHHLQDADCPCYGRASSRHIDLQICERLRHTWSPVLGLEVDPGESGGTSLLGRFGPHPNVWTLTIFSYACCAVLLIAGTMFGISQLVLGNSPTGFIPGGIGVMGIVGVYFAAGVGQKLGHDQMQILSDFLEAAISTPAPGEQAEAS